MAIGIISYDTQFQTVDSSGLPLVGGTLTYYLANTSTLAPIYSDLALSNLLPNPITLDINGRATDGTSSTAIYLDRSLTYKVICKDVNGVIQYTTNGIKDDTLPANLINAEGQLIIGDASGNASTLNIGAYYTVLFSNGTTALWQALTPLIFSIGDYKSSAISVNHGGPTASWWLLCNGAAISRTTFSALFGIIGTSFGSGDGSTTFNLPDFRSSVYGAIGQRSGLTNRTLGTFVGEEGVTLVGNQMPVHNHGAAEGNFVCDVGSGGNIGLSAGGNAKGEGTTANAGGNLPHNNMQPTLFAGNYFIFSGV